MSAGSIWWSQLSSELRKEWIISSIATTRLKLTRIDDTLMAAWRGVAIRRARPRACGIGRRRGSARRRRMAAGGSASTDPVSSRAMAAYPWRGSSLLSGIHSRSAAPAMNASPYPADAGVPARSEGSPARSPRAGGWPEISTAGASVPVTANTMPSSRNNASVTGSTCRSACNCRKYPAPRSMPRVASRRAASSQPAAMPMTPPTAPIAAPSASSRPSTARRETPSARSRAICARRRSIARVCVEWTTKAPVNRAISASMSRLVR